MLGNKFDYKAYATVLKFLKLNRTMSPDRFYSIKDIEKYLIRNTCHKCRQVRNYVSILQASGFLERTGALPEKYRLREEMIII